MLLGSHVSMSGKEMFLGSVKEALSYGANTFMVYTGAPQNTKRKEISELNIDAGWTLMREHDMHEIVIHAPYIINLGNAVKKETFEIGVEFLRKELERSAAMGSKILVLHPGSHVGEGTEVGIKKIIEGLNEVLTADITVNIALETMAGKGSEIGSTFEELAAIYGVIDRFDRIIGKNQIAVFHINDSKNVPGAAKDRHENIGFGQIGFDALNYIVHHPDFKVIPKILETPYIKDKENPKKSYAPYLKEIQMLKNSKFDCHIFDEMV